MKNPFRYFKTSPEIIRLAVMMYVRFPLSLRHVEDLLDERGIEVSHETIRFWWNRFGPIFAAEIRKKRTGRMRALSGWRWHLDEVFVKINGERHYLWRAVDQEGEVLEVFVSKKRDRKAALKFLRKLMKRYASPDAIITDRLRSYRAALHELGGSDASRNSPPSILPSTTTSTSDDPSVHGTISNSTAPLYSPSGVSSGRPNSLVLGGITQTCDFTLTVPTRGYTPLRGGQALLTPPNCYRKIDYKASPRPDPQ